MDSIVTSMKADYGGFRAELRKAYHGEFISSSKITGDLLHKLDTHEYFSNWDLRPVCQLSATSGDGFASRHLFDVNLSQTVFKPYNNDSQLNLSLQLELWASHTTDAGVLQQTKCIGYVRRGPCQILNEFAIKKQSIHQGLDSNSKTSCTDMY